MRSPGRIALAFMIPIAAFVTAGSADASTFRGPTTQAAGRHGHQVLPSNKILFTVAHGSVAGLTFPWVATCDGPSEEPLVARTDVLARLVLGDDGSFRVHGFYDSAPGQHQVASVDVVLS